MRTILQRITYLLIILIIGPNGAWANSVDITFFITSDTHYGVDDDEAIPVNQKTIDLMNTIPGTPYPPTIGGNVDAPRAVIVTGDLTQDAKAEEWKWFTTDYGLNGEGRLNYPVYEGWGNHDQHGNDTSAVTQGISRRNRKRQGITRVSKNGYHYSWDWDGVHFVQLNIYPGLGDGDPNSWGSPLNSLAFLDDDLAAATTENTNLPVILFLHFAFDGWGRENWSTREQITFYEAVKDYNIVAMFGGHGHAALQGTWKGIQYYEVSATQPESDDNGFTVVHITDEKMIVATREIEGQTWGKVFIKSLLPAGN